MLMSSGGTLVARRDDVLRYNLVRLVSVCVVWLAISAVANAATLTLAWNASSGPDVAGYVMYWGTQSGVYSSSLDVGNQTQQQVTGLADGTTYYFVVKAYNSAGALSLPSNEAAGPTPALIPTPGCPPCGGNGDMNGDGTPDLILQNDTTSQVLVQYLGGPPSYSLLGTNWLATTGVGGWRFVATADFNGDGRPDFVWQNDNTRQAIVWYMGASNTILSWDWLATSGVEGWRLVDAVDLNGDGHPDLLWQNDATFQVVAWYMGGTNGNSFVSWNYLASSGVEGWRLMAARDFNRDHAPDLVWQNDARQALVWYMGGTLGNSIQSWDWLSPWEEPGWRVVGARDFDGDGKLDLVWQHDDTRQVVLWFMGGTAGNVFQGWRELIAPSAIAGWTAIAR
jgi:hypothetical protein